MSDSIEYRGQRFASYKAMAEVVGVWHERITWRLRNSDMTLEEAVDAALAEQDLPRRRRDPRTDEELLASARIFPTITSSNSDSI